MEGGSLGRTKGRNCFLFNALLVADYNNSLHTIAGHEVASMSQPVKCREEASLPTRSGAVTTASKVSRLHMPHRKYTILYLKQQSELISKPDINKDDPQALSSLAFCVFQEPAVFVKTEIEEGDATQPEMISGRQASRMQVG